MTPVYFLAFVTGVAVLIIAATAAVSSRRIATGVAIGLILWLGYVGAWGWSGSLRNPALRPPGILFIVVPAIMFIALVLVRSGIGRAAAAAIPLSFLLGAQVYRTGVELFFHQLWIEGLVPKMLTFEGANVDIAIGLTAPLIAWIATRGRGGLRVALGWNVLGLAALANVAVRSALTAPGPMHLLHVERPNLAIGTFPYMFIPGFLAPLAVALHVLAIRAIVARLRAMHGPIATIVLGRDPTPRTRP